MSKLFHESHRSLQRQFDTERLADRIEQRLFREQLSPDDRAFIERMNMFFLATADACGQPNCSYKGGDPGFVRVLDERTIAFPNYDGNGMYLSMGNIGENAQVGLLFIDFENQKRLRLTARPHSCPATASTRRVFMSLVSSLPWFVYFAAYGGLVLLAMLLQRRVWQVPMLAMFIVTFLGTALLHSLTLLYLYLSGSVVAVADALGVITLPSVLLNMLIAIPMYGMMRDLAGWVFPGEGA